LTQPSPLFIRKRGILRQKIKDNNQEGGKITHHWFYSRSDVSLLVGKHGNSEENHW
jgi:hypothetical protein